MNRFLSVCASFGMVLIGGCASTNGGSSVDVAERWANNSVNAEVFRKNSLVTHGDTQFIAFYDKERHVVLGKRKLGTSA